MPPPASGRESVVVRLAPYSRPQASRPSLRIDATRRVRLPHSLGSCRGAPSCHHQRNKASRPSLRIDATRRVRLPHSLGSCRGALSCHHQRKASRPSLRIDATRRVQGLRPLLGWCSTPGIFALLTGVELPGFFAPTGPADNQPSLPCRGADSGYRREATWPLPKSHTSMEGKNVLVNLMVKP